MFDFILVIIRADYLAIFLVRLESNYRRNMYIRAEYMGIMDTYT